jgi:hypothetical protein
MSKSFLFQNCDFLLNYAGCVYRNEFLKLDLTLIILHCFSICLYTISIVKAVRNQDWKNLQFTKLEAVVVIAIIFHIFRIGLLQNIRRIGTMDLDTISNQEYQSYVRENILLQVFQNGAASLSANVFMVTILSIGTGVADLFSSVTIRGITINPQTVLTSTRIVLLIYTLIVSIVWSTSGLLLNVETYYYFKRLAYLPFGFVILCVTGPAVLYNGLKVVSMYEKNLLSQHKSIITASAATIQESMPRGGIQRGSNRLPSQDQFEVLKKERVKAQKRAVLGLRVILFLNFIMLNTLSGLSFITSVFIHESFQSNQMIFLIQKISFEFIFYISSTFFSVYLIW